MRIVIESIPHNHQRYPTAGDWQINPVTRDITILVSETGVDVYNYLLALHELAEVIWCIMHGVSQHEVDAWDIHHENMREADPTNPQFQREPGDNLMAPYYPGHRLGDIVERLMVFALNADWQHYEATLDDLDNRYGRPAFRDQTRVSDEAANLIGVGGLAQAAARDYGRRSTIIRGEVPLQAQRKDEDQSKKGNEAPKTDPRVPRRADEDTYPIKTPSQPSKNDQGEGDGW